MNDIDKYSDFVPQAGERFWYITEVVEGGLPTLKFVCTIFNPMQHKHLIEKHNCYKTRQQAVNSL